MKTKIRAGRYSFLLRRWVRVPVWSVRPPWTRTSMVDLIEQAKVAFSEPVDNDPA